MTDAASTISLASTSTVQIPKTKVKKAPASRRLCLTATSKPSHPPTKVMVNRAIVDLKEKRGSSLSAIKKYVGSTYNVDVKKKAPFICKYLRIAVESGKLIRTRGRGANGSFKLAKEKKPAVAAAQKKEASKVEASVEATIKTFTAARKSKTTGRRKPAAVARKPQKRRPNFGLPRPNERNISTRKAASKMK